jgi:iron complex outermembrane receptor protein
MSATCRTSLFVTLLLAAAATSLAAQQGTITGRVLDGETRAPIEGAEVSVGVAIVQTNAQGSFSIQAPAGTVIVTVRATSYLPQARSVTVQAGQTATLQAFLAADPIALPPVNATVYRGQAEREAAVPAAASVIERSDIEAWVAPTVADYVVDQPGVDAAQSGIHQKTIVTRGFNNVFSGSLLVLTDYRYARVPSLRLNAYNMIPIPALDIQRIEMVLGPASALYGPNSANGIMHIITSSPIDDPGTSVSVGGGNQSIFTGAFRQAFRFNDQVGLKVTGQYFRGNDFEYRDPAEVPDPSNPLTAARDFDVERFGGEVRLDVRPWEDAINDGVWFTYGLNQLGSSIELTGIGAGQAKDWRYQYGQVRFQRSGLFAQAFYNTSDAGDTYLLRTGAPIVDESTVLAGQVQYAFMPIERLELTAGFDASQTTPRTASTITGSNEDSDETLEIGGYLSGRVELMEGLDFVAALRVDDHEHLEDQVWSPRVGLVYEPVQGHAFRATYNRAFSTPTTNNLFLDISSGTIPIVPGIGYDVRTSGVPETGFTWSDQCAGGVSSFCMYSPFVPGMQLPAAGSVLWEGVIVEAMLADPTIYGNIVAMGLDSASFRTAMAAPTPGDLASVLRRFNHENASFPLDAGVTPVDRIRPTITTTYEVGYQGLIAERLRFSVSLYRNDIHDFVGPLRVETPSVFLDGTSVAGFVGTRLVMAGVPSGPATAFAAGVAPQVAMVPLGTVAPDQRSNSALLLTYRNFGEVELWGADVGFEAGITDQVAVLGSYSWVSEECFDFNDDGSCSSSADIALNAPTSKGSFGLRFRDRGLEGTGLELGARLRYSGEFRMNSGVYIGNIDRYAVVDVNAAYDVPGVQGLRASLTVNNVFDNEHQEFIGAPEMGIVALGQLTYEFGGN